MGHVAALMNNTIEEQITSAYEKYFAGVTVPHGDTPRVYSAIRLMFDKTGRPIDSIVKDLALQYKMLEMQRKN